MENNAPGLIILSDLSDNIGKVVQLYIHDVPILVVGPNKRFFHRDILSTILEQRGIPFEKIKFGNGQYGPKKQGELYVAVGMGIAYFFSKEEKIINLFGYSVDYELRINPEHIKKIQPHMEGIEFIVQ